jgi:predicted metal-dependent enzyme (double-stranded beta helix superfamily)
MADIYTVENYVRDLKVVRSKETDDAAIMARVGPLATKLAQNGEHWLRPEHYVYDQDRGSGIHQLHEEDDHTLMIFAACFKPGRITPVHDHGTWAVVSGVVGTETNEAHVRSDDGSKPGLAEIVKGDERQIGHGDIVNIAKGAFHVVRNDTADVTISLHTYGYNPTMTDRSQYNPSNGELKEYKYTIHKHG